jgi:hypothetical protein
LPSPKTSLIIQAYVNGCSPIFYSFGIIDKKKKKVHKERIIVVPWPFQHMFVKQLINFETFISTNEIISKYSLFSFAIFFYLEEIIFENFNIFENNIISVELAKVLRYFELDV